MSQYEEHLTTPAPSPTMPPYEPAIQQRQSEIESPADEYERKFSAMSADGIAADVTEVEYKGNVLDKYQDEQVMTLLPPPSSWFDFEDDICKSVDDTSTRKRNGAQHLSSHDAEDEGRNCTSVDQQTENTAVLDNVASTSAPFDRGTNSSNSSTQQTTSLLATSKNVSTDAFPNIDSNPSLDCTNNAALPQWNSDDAQMFDLSPIVFSHDRQYQVDDHTLNKHKDTTSEMSDSLSLSSAIDTIISQTLSLTTKAISQTIPSLLHECSSSAIQKAMHKLQTEYARLGPNRYLRASDLGSVGGYFRPPAICNLTASNEDDGLDETMVNIQSSVALGKLRDNHFDWMWIDGREVQFTTLPWIERQLVHEWRTYEWTASGEVFDSSTLDDSWMTTSHEKTNKSREGTTTESNNGIEVEKLEEEVLSEDNDDDGIDTGEYERARTLAPRPLPRPEWEHAISCYVCQRGFGPTLHRHHCRR